MSILLTEENIRLWCGRFSYEQGEAYLREGSVQLVHYDPNNQRFEATVRDINRYDVDIEIKHNDIHAVCSCPNYHPEDMYCGHIAATMLNIKDEQTLNDATSSLTPDLQQKNNRLIKAMLRLFDDHHGQSGVTRHLIDSRIPLELEIVCKPIFYSYQKIMFAIELKVGIQRLYIVQKIHEFLECVARRECYPFSKNFTYDPQLHLFQSKHDSIIQQLIQIYRYECMHRETSASPLMSPYGIRGDRILLIQPYSWDSLLPLLSDCPAVKLEQDGYVHPDFQVTDESIPLHFEFDEALSDGYQLVIQGLDKLVIMPFYGLIIANGKLHKQPKERCQQLAGLQQLLLATPQTHIQIPQDNMGVFMDKLLPDFMKLGTVHVAQSISDRILQTPLKARLYLDRVRDRLLAGLEFQYGNIIINPLEADEPGHIDNRILMRDGLAETKILDLMESCPFARTESGYFIEDELVEYEFLYHIIPQLEKLLKVYATSAVKARIHPGLIPPKVVIDVDERTDWLEFRFEMAGIPESEIRGIVKSLEERHKYYRLPNGALLPLETEQFQNMIRFMNEVGIRKGEFSDHQSPFRIPIIRGLAIDSSQYAQENSVKLSKTFRQLLENIRNPDHLDFPLPNDLESVLRDYQKYGFQWLKTLAHYRFGGILADDMGLGKTVQSIAFIASVLSEIRDQGQPAIIVAPSSLMYNWRNEFKKFAPQIKAVVVDGTKTERSRLLRNTVQTDVLITSYPILRRDIEQYATLSFHTLFLDEAQFFKNYTTQTARSVKSVQARYRFALTGTPIENKLEELWSIYDAVFPELFSNRRLFLELPRETVTKRVRPFLLRRVKTDVLVELPEKIESIHASELLPEQKKLYLAYLAKLRQDTLKHLDEGDFRQNRIKILAGLTRLRQICCHPQLFVQDYSGSSAKFEQLFEIVEECQNAGKRALIFSQFTEMLGLIARELAARGLSFFYLDGKTPSADRVELVNRFNEGEQDLFLVSLKAGGTGLNLTGADTVILYDPWWNPAVEQQAADRAHRFGQKNVVQVLRLIAQGTVEDKIYELQEKKKSLIDEVIKPGHDELSNLTEKEIREILMIDSD